MATPQPEAHSADDDDYEAGARVHESGRGVLVHGLGGLDEVLTLQCGGRRRSLRRARWK